MRYNKVSNSINTIRMKMLFSIPTYLLYYSSMYGNSKFLCVYKIALMLVTMAMKYIQEGMRFQ